MTATKNVSKQISRIITAHRQREGGGFMVRRPVPSGSLDMIDPFLMLDHLGPTNYGPGEAVGAPDHPHRGQETISYVLEGEIEHRDSHGNHGVLTPGWVQWMSAASGVIHSEMPTQKMLKEGGVMNSFQIWVNLPAKYKMTAPRYQDVPPEKIPVFTSNDEKTAIKVIAGKVEDVTANIDTRTQIYFLDLRTTGQYTLDLPADMNAMVYNFHTEPIRVGNEKAELKEGQMAVIKTDGQPIGFEAAGSEEARVLVLAGTPIGEEVAQYGPFVMNTDEEIYQALADVETGRFGSIPGHMERIRQTNSANAARSNAGKE